MQRFGPAVLVTAAFIGPGTITTCVLAGTSFGFGLLWALVFATAATIILQEMSARLGAGAKIGLGEALLSASGSKVVRAAVATLVIAAIVVGNAAYEGGNLAGGALGFGAVVGLDEESARFAALGLAILAGAALARGRYVFLERVLIGLVVLMSAAFLGAAILLRPDLSGVLGGLVPHLPDGSTLTAVALIGTTIVPYNLFLHAAAARRRFGDDGDVDAARLDTVVAVGLGGLVSAAVLLVAAAAPVEGRNVLDIAATLEPVLGDAGRILMGVGLLAAGLTSAITAPMATGYVLSEILGGDDKRRQTVFRIGSFGVLIIGAIVASVGIRPVSLIVVAQAANGLLLPVVAVYLLMVMNRRSLLGQYANGLASNLVGGLVVLVAIGLGIRTLLRLIGLWP